MTNRESMPAQRCYELRTGIIMLSSLESAFSAVKNAGLYLSDDPDDLVKGLIEAECK